MFGRRRPAIDVQQAAGHGQRPEWFGPLLDLKQDLHRLGANASPHEPGGDLAELLDLVGAAVVHLGHIARRARQKHHHGSIAHGSAYRLLKVMDVVGRDSSRPCGGMAGKVDDAAQQLPLEIPDAQHANLRIGGAGWLDDGWISLSGVRHGEAVLHPEPAIERDLVLDPESQAAPGRDLAHSAAQTASTIACSALTRYSGLAQTVWSYTRERTRGDASSNSPGK